MKNNTNSTDTLNSLALQQKFKELVEVWEAATLFSSRLKDKSAHPVYKEIVGMGHPIVPFILQDLVQKPSWLVIALFGITKQNPIKKEHKGVLPKMVEDWLKWGKQHQYVN